MSDKQPSPRGKILSHILSAVLIIAICIAVAVTIFVVSSPKENQKFSDFFLLSGKMTADQYPFVITRDKPNPMYIGVGNHEYKNTSYRIEIWDLVTEFNNETNTTRVVTMDYQEAMSFTLSHNMTTTIPYNLSVRKLGYNQVEFLLFKDNKIYPNATGSARINASYRDLYLRVFVV